MCAFQSPLWAGETHIMTHGRTFVDLYNYSRLTGSITAVQGVYSYL